ncbi:MAG: GMC family oxidoreductase [Sphingomonas sp.]
MAPPDRQYDHIVVGSGAAGGTVAARLAEGGRRVLVIEAGPDPLAPGSPGADHYSVPAFHALASEDPSFSWNQKVSHFEDAASAAKDGKAKDGQILYPRAGALGGCTAHNAMIFLTPPDEDWAEMEKETGDSGWSPAAMKVHRRSIERCRHRPFWRLLARLGFNPTGHGWDGWLPVEKAVPARAVSDAALMRSLFLASLSELGRAGLSDRLRAFISDWGDPNDLRRAREDQLCYLPLATDRHARYGTRERLRSVKPGPEGALDIATDTLATRLIFAGKRAAGVEWLAGPHLYRASPLSPGTGPGKEGHSLAARSVILAGGAFGTPQLLMLSGVGDPDHLRSIGIEPEFELPEVGRNLQDRYEISIVHRMARPWKSLVGARVSSDDPLYRRWRRWRRGMYVSNGTTLAALRRSSGASGSDPDLVLMGLMGRFSGYFPGYADTCWPGLDAFSWAVLKGRTGNRSGTVRLASRDPRDPPKVEFRNFGEHGEKDLDALVEGVAMVRSMMRPLLETGEIAEEEIPGRSLDGEALRNWVRSNAWGHHACGSAAIGPVLDARGRVRGVDGLRVVDASIFPRIPGLFIVAAIYLAAEKLASDILAEP